MSDDRVHVFSNGTEYEIWRGWNCDECTKSWECPIEDAIIFASGGDGLISREIAVRMGRVEDERDYAPICPERELP